MLVGDALPAISLVIILRNALKSKYFSLHEKNINFVDLPLLYGSTFWQNRQVLKGLIKYDHNYVDVDADVHV